MRRNLHCPLTASPILAYAICCLGLSGCAVHIKTAQQPAAQTGSALKTVNPLRISLAAFQDSRAAHTELLGNVGTKFRQADATEVDVIVDLGAQKVRGDRKFLLDMPVAAWVRESIRREFERNGHTCVIAQGEQAGDLTIEGSVYQYSVDARFVGVASTRLTGNVGAELSIRTAKNPKPSFAKKFNGTFYTDKFGFTVDNVIQTQNQALLNMMRELTADADLLDFLRHQSQPHAQSP